MAPDPLPGAKSVAVWSSRNEHADSRFATTTGATPSLSTRNRLRSKRPTNVALDALADPDALLNNTQEGPEQPEQIVERGTDMALVEQALLQLPMHLRAAATLRFIEGRSHPEIAEILNQPIGTVKSHVHRAVRILRRILGPQVGRLPSSGETANAVL